jgi:hypothetical protein
MKSALVAISWGELFDKLTILEIKLEKLTSKIALENVRRECKQLSLIFNDNFSANDKAHQLNKQLRQINQQLWDIEDAIRVKERESRFDEDFIQLARSVYIINDERFRIKKNINKLFGSEITEEKSYADY